MPKLNDTINEICNVHATKAGLEVYLAWNKDGVIRLIYNGQGVDIHHEMPLKKRIFAAASVALAIYDSFRITNKCPKEINKLRQNKELPEKTYQKASTVLRILKRL